MHRDELSNIRDGLNNITGIINSIINRDEIEIEDKNKRIKNLEDYMDTIKKLNERLADALRKSNEENSSIKKTNAELQTSYYNSEAAKNVLQKEKDATQEKNNRLTEENNKLKEENKRLQEKNNELETSINKLKEPVKTPAAHKKANYGPILREFNAWAAWPTTNLPDKFIYVEGYIKIKTKQNIVTTTDSTKWIINRGDGEKFLFPNPVSFDDRTDISELYEGEMDKIKPEDNRIEVLEPCEISDTGFIQYKGKFRLL